ncbi:MAG: type II toxin-antitoxin system VapB family antitoxin [Acidobacteriaceae bacterium]
MALHIDNPKAAELALQLAQHTGETVDEATIRALEERLARTSAEKPAVENQEASSEGVAERLMAIGRHFSSLPDVEVFDPDEWLYDEHGLPH